MLHIDGSEGEGGGQMVRNSCALSLVTGQPFRISNIRARRSRPGLMRQHVTAVEAACAISNSTCEGLMVGSSELTFRPGSVVPGEYQFAVGTAGSTGLVLQTILMPLALASAPSRLVIEGGTHNMMAPPFDFIERCFLPIVNRMGPRIAANLVRHGFYPRGGGRIEVEIEPAPLAAIECVDRGPLLDRRLQVAFTGLPFDVAERMVNKARKALTDWPEEAFPFRELPADQGPGVILLAEAAYANVTEIVSGFGRLGVPSERIAQQTCSRLNGYVAGNAFAGPYLQDQLILPFVLARGGAFTLVKPSQHTVTAVDIARQFTGRTLAINTEENGSNLISVS